ncbi:MAG: peptide chain release factor N(5)-glutamine methyltransferase [Desulfomonilaceae bacterium]
MEEQLKTRERWTIGAILNWTATYFAGKGVKTPRLDAEILLAHCLDVDRLYLYLNLDRPLLPDERSRFRELVKRRGLREPVALITGKKEFWSISLQIKPGILIPRPETEILVEVVLQEIKENPAPKVLEIGTGSGAVAIALAKDNPRVEVLATDTDFTVLLVAQANAKEAELENAVQFIATDLFDSIRRGGYFDVICSNPPYVPTNIIPRLDPDVRNFEPMRALDGGPDGLDVIRRLTANAENFLNRPGALVLEFGDGQEEAVGRILVSAGFEVIRIFRDLSGKPRVIKGTI